MDLNQTTLQWQPSFQSVNQDGWILFLLPIDNFLPPDFFLLESFGTPASLTATRVAFSCFRSPITLFTRGDLHSVIGCAPYGLLDVIGAFFWSNRLPLLNSSCSCCRDRGFWSLLTEFIASGSPSQCCVNEKISSTKLSFYQSKSWSMVSPQTPNQMDLWHYIHNPIWFGVGSLRLPSSQSFELNLVII